MPTPDRLEVLQTRSELLKTTRQFFYDRNFIEVQTPTLSRDTMIDSTIDPIPVRISGQPQTFYLQTSPEFSMKRLLTEGCHSIFEITPAFRNQETGQFHNPEFTMLEWYRVGDDYKDGIDLLGQFAQCLFPHREIDNRTYQEVFTQTFSINPHTASQCDLYELCQIKQIDFVSENWDCDSLLQVLMAECIEPQLGVNHLSIIRDWPACQSALAKLRSTPEDYKVSERFELYVDGIELANGYHELINPEEQRKRMQINNNKRILDGLQPLPMDSQLIEAMTNPGLPSCSGVALGFDRLLQVKLGLPNISTALAFDIENA